jgi:hypothetical protein
MENNMANAKRLTSREYAAIKALLYEGMSTGDVYNELKDTIPALKRTQVYAQDWIYKHDIQATSDASLDLTTERTELDNNTSTTALEMGEVSNMPRAAKSSFPNDKPRMGSNDTVETPVAVRPSIPRQEGRRVSSPKPVQSVASPIESAIMKWELQGFSITTTRGDTINIELSPESLKDIVNHLLR